MRSTLSKEMKALEQEKEIIEIEFARAGKLDQPMRNHEFEKINEKLMSLLARLEKQMVKEALQNYLETFLIQDENEQKIKNARRR